MQSAICEIQIKLVDITKLNANLIHNYYEVRSKIVSFNSAINHQNRRFNLLCWAHQLITRTMVLRMIGWTFILIPKMIGLLA